MSDFPNTICPKCKTLGKIIQSRACNHRVICMECGLPTDKNIFMRFNNEITNNRES